MNVFIFALTLLLCNQACSALKLADTNDHNPCNIYNTYNVYNLYNNPDFHNVYNAQQYQNYQHCSHFNNQSESPHDHSWTTSQTCPTNPTNPITPTKSLVKRSENTVTNSKNFIQPAATPLKNIFTDDVMHRGFMTRTVSSIVGAPVGTTDVTTLTMETDLHITNIIEFSGITAINGNGNILYLDEGGVLQINTGSTLNIKNVTIRGVGGKNILCVDDTGNVSVQNVTWVQDNDFTFDHGSIDVMNDFHCIGNGLSFIYSTIQACTLHSGAIMTLDYNFTFNYAPANLANNLFIFADQTSTLSLFGAYLATNSGGLMLQKGLIFIDGQATFNGLISLGNGINNTNDTICLFGSAASLNLEAGTLTYNNVSGSSWNMRDINASLKISPNTTFNLLTPINLCSGMLQISTNATFSYPPGVQVSGSVSFF